MLHPSRVYHAGKEIDAGKRYILVGFVQVGTYLKLKLGQANYGFLSYIIGQGTSPCSMELSLEEVWCSGSMHGASGG